MWSHPRSVKAHSQSVLKLFPAQVFLGVCAGVTGLRQKHPGDHEEKRGYEDVKMVLCSYLQ